MHQQLPVLIFVVLAFGFSLYRRARRTVGFQPYAPRRLMFRAILLGVVGIVILAYSAVSSVGLLADAAGLVLGAVLAAYGIRGTTFEQRGEKWFYRPHAWIGMLLLLLFIVRLVYRAYLYSSLFRSGVPSQAALQGGQLASLAHDPLTGGLLFAVIGYTLFYTALLVRSRSSRT